LELDFRWTSLKGENASCRSQTACGRRCPQEEREQTSGKEKGREGEGREKKERGLEGRIEELVLKTGRTCPEAQWTLSLGDFLQEGTKHIGEIKIAS